MADYLVNKNPGDPDYGLQSSCWGIPPRSPPMHCSTPYMTADIKNPRVQDGTRGNSKFGLVSKMISL